MCIKAQKIRSIGNTVRMDEETTMKRITEYRPTSVRRTGKPRLR